MLATEVLVQIARDNERCFWKALPERHPFSTLAGYDPMELIPALRRLVRDRPDVAVPGQHSPVHNELARISRVQPNCDTSVLSETRLDDQLDRSIQLANEWNALGYRVENVDSLTTRVDAVRVYGDGTEAEVTACESDGTVLWDGDVVVNDEYVSAVYSLQVFNDAGAWKVFQTAPGQRTTGEENDLCN